MARDTLRLAQAVRWGTSGDGKGGRSWYDDYRLEAGFHDRVVD